MGLRKAFWNVTEYYWKPQSLFLSVHWMEKKSQPNKKKTPKTCSTIYKQKTKFPLELHSIYFPLS